MVFVVNQCNTRVNRKNDNETETNFPVERKTVIDIVKVYQL